MEPSKKQLLYLEITERILPFLRNIQTHSLWRRMLYGNFFAELELVHNLPRCLVYPEFREADIWWLNCQAKIYIRECANRKCPSYEAICGVIAEIFLLVPQELKEKLNWSGPQSTANNSSR
jgi:hypothetical protein